MSWLLDTSQMTSATAGAAHGRPYAIRLPLAVRAYVVIFMCIWCVPLLGASIGAAVHGSPGFVGFAVPMLAFGLALGYRIIRLSVTLNPDDLLVRGYFHTRRIVRADIEGFRQGSQTNQPFTRVIYVLLRDGTVFPLDVTARMYVGRGKARLADRTRSLQSWLGHVDPGQPVSTDRWDGHGGGQGSLPPG
jgi:hypothetical protein